MTANRAWAINGPGSTIINGPVSTTTAFNLSPTYTGQGNSTLRLNGAFTALNNGTFTVAGGRLISGANEIIPDFANDGNSASSPLARSPDRRPLGISMGQPKR